MLFLSHWFKSCSTCLDMKTIVPENMLLNACKVRISGTSMNLCALTLVIELGKQSRFRLITKESDMPSDSEVYILWTTFLGHQDWFLLFLDRVPCFQDIFDSYYAQCRSSSLAGKLSPLYLPWWYWCCFCILGPRWNLEILVDLFLHHWRVRILTTTWKATTNSHASSI